MRYLSGGGCEILTFKDSSTDCKATTCFTCTSVAASLKGDGIHPKTCASQLHLSLDIGEHATVESLSCLIRIFETFLYDIYSVPFPVFDHFSMVQEQITRLARYASFENASIANSQSHSVVEACARVSECLLALQPSKEYCFSFAPKGQIL